MDHPSILFGIVLGIFLGATLGQIGSCSYHPVNNSMDGKMITDEDGIKYRITHLGIFYDSRVMFEKEVLDTVGVNMIERSWEIIDGNIKEK
jgi:hypothetical protein